MGLSLLKTGQTLNSALLGPSFSVAEIVLLLPRARVSFESTGYVLGTAVSKSQRKSLPLQNGCKAFIISTNWGPRATVTIRSASCSLREVGAKLVKSTIIAMPTLRCSYHHREMLLSASKEREVWSHLIPAQYTPQDILCPSLLPVPRILTNNKQRSKADDTDRPARLASEAMINIHETPSPRTSTRIHHERS